MFRRPPLERSSTHDPVLGTRLHFQLWARSRHAFAEAEALLLTEIERLESVFSAYRPDSEFCRWRSSNDDATRPSGDLTDLLRLAADWQRRSNGIFNPAVGLLTTCWQAAAHLGRLPASDYLQARADAIAAPRFTVDDEGHVLKLGDCSVLNMNAIAKGFIVQRAADHVRANIEVDGLVVNIGGDLVHWGSPKLEVTIENPHRPFDNEPPIAVTTLVGQAMATSGGARRGVTIAGRHYSHVIDPRSGQPCDAVASATVVAPDAATADIVATVVSVLAPSEGVEFVNGLADVEALVVGADKQVSTSHGWRATTR